MGQSELENGTSPGPNGMVLVELTSHFHPTLAKIRTYTLGKCAARIFRPMITRHSDGYGLGRHPITHEWHVQQES
jgi:hypothetical protein